MNLAVFLPNWIGDVVMATPALRALRQQFRNARIVGVCKPYVAGALDGAPWLDELLWLDNRGPLSRHWPAAVWKLRARNCDTAVLFANTFRSALVARLAGCRRRVGFHRHGRGWLLTEGLDYARSEGGGYKPTPLIDDYNRLAVAAGCPAPNRRMELFTTAEDENAADRVWKKLHLEAANEVFCLNPGAAFGAAKHWQSEAFARLAQEIVDRRRAKALVLCGPSERDLARRIVALANRPGVVSAADEDLSLGLTKALVRRATLLVTTDSGPRHFAAAFDCPVVTLFGPTHIEWTETYYPKAVHLQKKVPCGPCQLRVCPTDHACMRLLTPEEVFAAVESLLDRVQRKAS
jgi:heptosyltransferase-2